ncbi:hypothetical protein PsorP6_008902 [Peronosclerospora sorghi]|uniref:Uncharacterized protein n=1 Tax=Peronosclerospora sorghi TaxID=230839 RepID=A0ACC0W0B6_9STRA|nr:hypothetical protein PsorP6_008902 [Peronosclerospora sorghi]
MRARWVDSLKRSISVSPRPDEHSPRISEVRTAPTPSSTLSSVSEPSPNGAENPAFVHGADRCECVGTCSVARVLDNCVLQGGMHHTHMHILTYLGRPLRSDWCCYPVSVQWFRAVGEQDDFQVIPEASLEWYTPTADDIGARILAKVMIEDEDVLKAKMLEYGPIKEDPEVRSKVDMYLERKSVLFMGLKSIAVQDTSASMHEEELSESWTLLIDGRRVRLTCESSLMPPFESLYTPDIKLEMVHGTPNEFFLHLAKGCYVRLRAESNTVRDIIVLTLRAFCKLAISDECTHDSVARGLSPMMPLREVGQDEETKKPSPVGVSTNFGGLLGLSCMLRLYTPSLDFYQQNSPRLPPSSALAYHLPWNQSASNCSNIDYSESMATSTLYREADQFIDAGSRPGLTSSRQQSVESSMDGRDGWQHYDELDKSLVLDAEALIGNAQKMGIQYQILPRAPMRLSILDIPDLQIIEVMDILSEGSMSFHLGNNKIAYESEEKCSYESNNVDGSDAVEMPEKTDATCIDKAIEDFMADDKVKTVDVTVLRDRYVAIFCSLQRELHTYKQRVLTLSKQIEEKEEINASFRKDIESLRSVLTSLQLSDKVYDLVSTDLRQLVKHTAADAVPPGSTT